MKRNFESAETPETAQDLTDPTVPVPSVPPQLHCVNFHHWGEGLGMLCPYCREKSLEDQGLAVPSVPGETREPKCTCVVNATNYECPVHWPPRPEVPAATPTGYTKDSQGFYVRDRDYRNDPALMEVSAATQERVDDAGKRFDFDEGDRVPAAQRESYRFKTSDEAETLPLPLQILRLKEINAEHCKTIGTLVIQNARLEAALADPCCQYPKHCGGECTCIICAPDLTRKHIETLEAALADEREKIAKEEKAHEQTIKERDDAEECAGDLYTLVTGNSAEWSNLFGYEEAYNEVSEAVAAERQLREKAETALKGIPSHQAFDGPECICDENAPGTAGYKHHWSWCKDRRAALHHDGEQK